MLRSLRQITIMKQQELRMEFDVGMTGAEYVMIVVHLGEYSPHKIKFAPEPMLMGKFL